MTLMKFLLLSVLMAAVVVHAEDTVADTKLFGLMTQQCFDTFFVDMNFFHAECLKKLVSKGLGIAIIAGSFGLKIPQILTILKDRSVSGLEPAAFYLDVISFLATCCYNFLNGYPLTGWGESLVILVQNIFLVMLLFLYSTPPVSMSNILVITMAFGGCCFGLLNVPEHLREMMIWGSLAAAVAGRIPQAYANFVNGHTGVLAWQTFFLSFAGSIARIFTTIQETGDMTQVASFAVSSFTNLVILVQIIYYSSATKAHMDKLKAEKVK